MTYTLRKTKSGDGRALAKFWNEGIRRKFFVYNGSNKRRDERWIKKFDEKKPSKNNYMIIAQDNNNEVLGLCVVIGREEGRMKHRVELGWLVHPDHARKGIATRMLKEVIRRIKKDKIKRAEAEIAIKNTASIKLVKKFGFIKESKREKGLTLDNGKYIDTYLYKKIF